MDTTMILLVEDDALIASGLTYALTGEGYQVLHAASIQAAHDALASHAFDLAILDVQLPDGDGFAVREALRGRDTAVLFLTVVDEESIAVRALEGGAEDYITKPFRLRELLARVKAALRRRAGRDDALPLGRVIVRPAEGKAYLDSAPLPLTALEYRLLLTFARHRGQLLTRAQILDILWDAAGNFVEDNTLTVYIRRLREKLGDAAAIETVRGMGYRAE
ncbi:MAG: response regulator transcription factor [Oscillospiraceae bacterium]|nr:response regulator transcription factor [Oscillospiraceae bacterium]